MFMIEPTLYDVLVEIVGPTTLGLGAIAVGVASWTVAVRSTSLSERLAEESRQAALRTEKIDIATSVFDWVALKWPAERPENVSYLSEASKALSRASAMLAESSLPNTDMLLGVLREYDSRATVPYDEIVAWSYLSGSTAGSLDVILRDWLKDPSRPLRSLDTIRLAIDEMKSSARRKEKAFKKKLRRVAKKRERAARASSERLDQGGSH